MSEQGLKGLVSEWRSISEPGKGIGSKGVFKGEVQRTCAEELQSFLERLEALEQDLASFRANCEHDQPHFGDFAGRLGRLLRGA